MKKLIGLLASLKTAIFLIGLLTLLAIIGTLIPQRLEAINYIQGFPKSWQFIMGMGFDDMYRCHTFIGTLALLSASAILCVLIRTKSLKNKLFGRLRSATVAEIKTFENSALLPQAPNKEILKGYSFQDMPDGTIIGFKSSGKLALIGGLVLHIGLVLVFAGGLLGLLFGVEMPLNGREGEMIPVPSLEVIRAAVKADNMSRQARHIRQFSPMDPRLEKMRAEIEKLHMIYQEGVMKPEFKVAFDKLWIEHYSDATGKQEGIKSWNTRVRFLEVASGSLSDVIGESEPQTIKVNYPVSYRDYGFFQASWEKTWKKLKFKVEFRPDTIGWEDYKPAEGTFPQTIEVPANEPFTIKGFDYSLMVSSFMPDFKLINGNFYNVSNELNNPAALIIAFKADTNEEVGHTWGFPADKAAMAGHVSNLPITFEFENAEYEYESLIQMTYDPGKPFVWAGCILFCLGMMMTFYIFYKEEWIIFQNDGSAFIAVNSNRASNILKKDLEIYKKRLIALQKEDK